MSKKRSALQEAIDNVSNFIGGTVNTVQKTLTPLAKPTIDFTTKTVLPTISGPVGELSRLHNMASDFSKLPEVNLTKNIQNPYLKFIAEIPQSIINSPRTTGQGIIGLEQNIKDVYTGKPVRIQDVGANVGKAIDLPLNVVTGGQGKVALQLSKRTLPTVFKQGFKTGAQLGAGFGVSQGLRGAQPINDPLQYLTHVGVSTAMGAGSGGILGGVFEPILYMTGQKGIRPSIEAYNKMTPEQQQAGFARFFMEFPEKMDKANQLALAQKQGWFHPDFLTRLEQGKVSAGDLTRLGIKITKTDMKTLLKTTPELTKNPTLHFEDGLLKFNGNKIKFAINPEAIGIEPTRLKPGDTINISGALSQSGKIPVLIEKTGRVTLKQPTISTTELAPTQQVPPGITVPETALVPNRQGIGMLLPETTTRQTPQETQGLIRVNQQLPSIDGVPPAGEVKPPMSSGRLPSGTTADEALHYTWSKIDQLYTEAMDRFHPLSKAAKGTPFDQAMRNAITGHYGIGSIGKYYTDFKLGPILRAVPLDDLRTAGIAMRDLELATRNIKGSNLGGLDFGELSRFKGNQQQMEAIARLQQLRARVGDAQMKKIGDTLNLLYAYQDDLVREYLVKTGLMSQAQYAGMKAKNQFYVPFKRQMDFVDNFLGVPPRKGAGSIGTSPIRGIKGSERDIIDPIESIIENTYKIISAGKRQEVAQTIAKLKDVLPPGTIRKYMGPIGGRPSISVFENGKAVHYLVPAEIADAAKGLSEEQIGTIMKIAAMPAQVFRATATGINPEFTFPNIARDVLSAFVNINLHPLAFVRGFAHYIKQDDVFKEYLKAGSYTSRISLDQPTLKKSVLELSKTKTPPTSFINGITSFPKRVVGAGVSIRRPSDILHMLEAFGAYSEQPTRIAAFEKVLKQGLQSGLTQEEAGARAAYAAQEATVNFARRGSKTRLVNMLYAFLNAQAQGIDRFIRTMKDDPIGAGTRVAMVTAVPALALYAHNRNFKSYSDERIVPQYEKDRNFIIMLSDTPIPELGGGQYIKIPKGSIGILANPLEQFMSYADNKGGDVQGALLGVLQSFMPIDITSPNQQTGKTDITLHGLIPTALKPPIELGANKNFFTGSSIVNPNQVNFPREYQFKQSTPKIYKTLGTLLKQSPSQLQHIAEGYGTGYAKILGASSNLAETIKGDKSFRGADINQVPVIRRFLGGPKMTVEEQQQSQESGINALNFRINEIKAGINRGQLPLDVGVKAIQELQQQQQDLINKSTGQGKTTRSTNNIYTFMENGKFTTVDLNPFLKPATGLKQYEQTVEKYKTARDVFSTTGLKEEDKLQIYKTLNLQPEDVEYDALAHQPTAVKGPYLYDLLKGANNQEAVLKTLIQGRIDSISGEQFVNNATIDDLHERGLITADEAKYVKSFKFDKKGNDIGTKAKGAKPKKFTFPKATAPKFSTRKIKLQSVKPISPLKLKLSNDVKIVERKPRITKPTPKTAPIGLKLRTPVTSIRQLGRA